MDRLFLCLGICTWIWARKHRATWNVSGYIPMCCVSRQEAGNITMIPVISVANRQFKTKNTLFLCLCMQMCSLRLQFADLSHDLPPAHKITVNQTGAFYLSHSEDVFNFSRNRLMNPILLSQSLWMFSVFTSNLNSQTTWLTQPSESQIETCKLMET